MSEEKPSMDTPQVAVVVLNWNGRALLEDFAPSWVAYTPQPRAELIIVDNGSTDGSVDYLREHYPAVRLICFEENYGFAEGYNRAIASLPHPIIVLLNSDVRLSAGWLEEALELLEADPSIVAVQPKIRSLRAPQDFEYAGAAGGYIDRWGYPLCRGRILDTLEEDRGQYDEVCDIFWASGACLIVRREAYLSAGGLDARFFAHQEEIDLCWRLQLQGGRIVAAPRGIVYHLGGGSLDMNNPRKCYLNFRNNLLMLYKNLPLKRWRQVVVMRFILDLLASGVYLLRGQRRHARAVLAAWRDARQMFPDFAGQRNRGESIPSTMLRKSVLWQYYALGIKRFSEFKR